ncbi:molybdopterin molybdotransferase MoeA [Halococcus saccharolyticus]|uniref:Molybdenum cofactor synthesis protein n=1 Tax=Halococcus saccharolyticus DSM 5350 TaxID=1227455 RepID=M0MH75_9EURY|nr:gephyrin-like molybdotransferase Glp [Halococcus saccharolyticus]EMA44029.1 molybdenum cofactor synthesis protein [Halococcus saccharolyticus DSM 5350]
MNDVRESGFKRLTRLETARERLLDRIEPSERVESVGLLTADDRVLAEPVVADRDVPHYRRAAMDGFAVRATDTFDASRRSPAVLRRGAIDDPGTATRVHTGSELPDGADAVVMVEHVETVGDEIEVFDPVAAGKNVAPVGEDVRAGKSLYDPGHRLRPSDLGLLKSVGVDEVAVYERPTVGVIPTGEELVQRDPDPGEVVETNGLTTSRYVERWGGRATYREVVTDDRAALRAAIERDLTKDLVVTTGGSSVGERDLVPEIVDDLGEVLVHGIGCKPGHPAGFGVVADTPVLMLPGYPVSCIVAAVQLLRPALRQVGHRSARPHPTTDARLDRKIASEPGVQTYARVELRENDDDMPTAVPTRTSGAGALSSVALADGWVVVATGREGIPAGETVAVEHWEEAP